MIRMIAAVFALLFFTPAHAQEVCEFSIEQAREFEASGQSLPGRWFEADEAQIMTEAFNALPPESEIAADTVWFGLDPQGRGGVIVLFKDGCMSGNARLSPQGVNALITMYTKLEGQGA